MPVFVTLNQLAVRWGLNSASTTDQAVMLRFYNQAVKELNESTDTFGSLAEIAIPLEAPSKITFPQEVVSLRGVRWTGDKTPYSIYPVSSKYCWTAWKNAWRAFVPVGYIPTLKSFDVTGQVTLRTLVADSSEVVIVGSTTGSNRLAEVVVMDATTKTTVSAFSAINSIVRKVIGTYDVTLYDSGSNKLAVLRNNAYHTKYYTVDISEFPAWSASNSNECSRLVECLVKIEVPEVVSIYEETPFQGYDDVLIDYCSYLWSKEKEDGNAAIAFKTVVDGRLQQLNLDQTGAEQASINYEPHPHDRVQPYYGKFIPNRLQRWP
jgi:hypothetical protein